MAIVDDLAAQALATGCTRGAVVCPAPPLVLAWGMGQRAERLLPDLLGLLRGRGLPCIVERTEDGRVWAVQTTPHPETRAGWRFAAELLREELAELLDMDGAVLGR